jgi:hypothetical protein
MRRFTGKGASAEPTGTSRPFFQDRPARRGGALQRLQPVQELGDHLFAVADEDQVHEIRQRLHVEHDRAAHDHERIVLGPGGRAERDAGQVEHLQHVGEGHLVLQREPHHVEVAERCLRLQRRQRPPVPPKGVGHVRPRAEDALGRRVVAGVDVRDQDAVPQMGHADLVHVRETEGEGQLDVAVVLDHLVPFAADVPCGPLHVRQDALEQRVETAGNLGVRFCGAWLQNRHYRSDFSRTVYAAIAAGGCEAAGRQGQVS